jgi:hypothetical protein
LEPYNGQRCLEVVTKEKSSNWQELNNLVEALEQVIVEHDIVRMQNIHFYG